MKTISLILFLLLTVLANPLYAGMEPFWRGQWGLSMGEIQSMENRTLETAYYEPIYKYNLTSLIYEGEILGQPAKISYLFSNNRLVTTVCNIHAEDLSFENAKALTTQYNNLAATTLNTGQVPFQERTRRYEDNTGFWWLQLALMQNENSAVLITSSYHSRNAGSLHYTIDMYDKQAEASQDGLEIFSKYWEKLTQPQLNEGR